MLSKWKVAATGVVAAFTAALLVNSNPAQADCIPEWAEDVGLPSEFVPRTFDFVSFDDGSGETLYAAGGFDVGPPDERTGAVRWTGETWEALEVQGEDATALSSVLAVYNGELYGAGGYRLFDPDTNTYTNHRVARWDPDASDWMPASEAIQDLVGLLTGAMAVFDGDLYFGGSHDLQQGLGSDRLSRFDGSSWGPPPAPLPFDVFFSVVRDLIVFEGALYASFGESFDPGSVWKLGPGASSWQQVGGVVPSQSRMAVFQGELYLAGTNSPGQPAVEHHLWRLVDGEWEPVPGSTSVAPFTFVESMIAADDGSGEALFLVGNIEDMGGAANLNHLAKWDGANWSGLGTGVHVGDDWDLPMTVEAVYEWNNGIWIGGQFEFVGVGEELIFSPGIARWSCPAATVDPELSTVDAAESAISSFAGQTRITVTPRDPNGELLEPDQDVVLLTNGGTLIGSVADQGDGTYRQYLEGDTDSDGAEILAIVNGVELDAKPFVSFVPVEPSLSMIDVSIDQTFLGGTATVTVTLLDDEENLAGNGFDVEIATTVGELEGSVVDHGDGTYSQAIIATETGTASITATVDDMALNTSAALSVLDPDNVGNVIGVDADGNTVGFLSIQAAIDAAEEGSTIFVSSGTYNETILLDEVSDLVIEGLSALEPVTLRGVVVSESSNVSVRHLTIDSEGANLPHHGVELRGGLRASDGVEIIGSTVVNASHSGVSVDRGNNNVSIVDSTIQNNGRYGVDLGRDGEGHLILNSVISGNGWTGVEIDRDVVVTVENNLISGNGSTFNNPNPNGYGLARSRQGGDGEPEEVTLIQNTFENNNGRVQNGRSDSDIRNYDQIIDETDDQSPYTD